MEICRMELCVADDYDESDEHPPDRSPDRSIETLSGLYPCFSCVQ